MTGRRVSRHGGAARKPMARKARAAELRAERAAAATGELAEFGLAYGRVRAALAKARKHGNSDAALRTVRALTNDLNAAAAAHESRTTRRR